MRYWLMKSEPNAFSIDALQEKQREPWEGVRNFQARNFMRDDMERGDLAFFYHSNCQPPGIVGMMELVKPSYPDFTAFDPASKYYDPKSTQDKPRWFMVDVKFKQKFKAIIPLATLRQQVALENMLLLRKGNRLSIMPVSKKEWEAILMLVSNQ